MNLQVLEACFQISINNRKNENIPSMSSKTVSFERIRKRLEAKNKELKKEGKANRPNAREGLSDDEINIF